MYIETENASFKPENFVLYKFYGKDTCFAWKENELVVFIYSGTESKSTSPLNVLTAPGVIKSIQEFEERVFVICTPCGIYKLTEKLQFATLSKSGIGIGSLFSKVLTLQGGFINLEDKQDKSMKKLFQVPSESVTSDELFTLKLIANETDQDLREVLLEEINQDDLCLIAYEKVLYLQARSMVKLLYNSEDKITEILPIERKKKVVGATLITDSSAVIFIYLEEKKLKIDKIYLHYDDMKAQAFCAKMDENNQNCISIVYSMGSKTFQCIKRFNLNSLKKIKVDECGFIALRFYKSDFVIGLNAYNELCQFPLKEFMEKDSQDDAEFVELKLKMLQGSEVIVDKICEKARELQVLTEKLEEEKDILKRINMYAYDFREEYCPEMRIKKIAEEKYLAVKFEKALPVNSQVVLAASRGDQRTFSIKKVTDSETRMELPLTAQNISKPIHVTVDLITYNPKGESVCLIKDFFEDPSKKNDKRLCLSSEKINFLNLKIRALKSFISEGKVTMEALSEIKRSIRREIRGAESQ